MQAYSGDARPVGETAVVRALDDERFTLGFTSYADFAGGDMSDFKSVGNSWIGYPKEMTMLPGRYLVMTHCATGAYYAFPSFMFMARAGKSYEVKCQYVKGELGKIEVVAREVDDNVEGT